MISMSFLFTAALALILLRRAIAQSSQVVAAYLPDYRFYINVNGTAVFLTDLIVFSVSPQPNLGSTILSSCCLNDDHYRIAREARSFKKEKGSGTLKLWLSVGGAGRSNECMTKPDELLNAIVALATEQGFDGIDLDCEFFKSQEDYRQYIMWLQPAASFLQKHGLLVSVALHSGQLLPPSLYQQLDRFHLMAYDMSGTYHAEMDLVKGAVARLVESGCPPHKIVVGIPAYARHSKDPSDVKTFAEIVDMSTEHGILEGTLDGMGELEGYRYDSPKAVRRKVRYAGERGLAGVFLWELGQDKQSEHMPGGILLTATSFEDRREEL